MNPNEYPAPPSPDKIHNPLEVMQPGEQTVCEIKRHPIGLIGIYVITGLVLAVTISAAILIPFYASILTDQQKMGVVLGAGLIVLTTLIFTYIGVYVYQANRWIVTTDSVTQVTQSSLFGRETSQLSLANLEDVSVDQDNFWQSLLGYGDLVVESAGEHSKFVFTFCPDPHEYARKIIAAHEEYIANRQHEMVSANRPLTVVQGYNQPASGPSNSPTAGMPPSSPTAFGA